MPTGAGIYLNFDWGSQSIAQSKFQRAPPRGKEFQQELLRFLRQHLIENIRKISAEELLLAVLDSSHRTAFAGSPRIEGEGGTCALTEPLQDLSVTQNQRFINSLHGNALWNFFCLGKDPWIEGKIGAPPPDHSGCRRAARIRIPIVDTPLPRRLPRGVAAGEGAANGGAGPVGIAPPPGNAGMPAFPPPRSRQAPVPPTPLGRRRAARPPLPWISAGKPVFFRESSTLEIVKKCPEIGLFLKKTARFGQFHGKTRLMHVIGIYTKDQC